ncbi:hypothetical protein [Fulvivirga sedimenti]|uniref:Uncharacterized protein n=1 Tax=Fulvivirga sedimenti TaxID=2879465 RepID=A0A9X1HNX5_9BACT|nr:hypothetical protein [Fulvivirga sedimenti]MCA6075613.1 hypothetical protein [Fulvivirga sedimenti]
MIKIIRLLLILITLGSCEGIKSELLEGKWAGTDPNGNYMELWFGDSLALSYLGGMEEFIVYNYDLSGNRITYSVRESFIPTRETFDNIVGLLNNDSLVLEYSMGDGTVISYSYYRLPGDVPEISGTGLLKNEKAYRSMVSAPPRAVPPQYEVMGFDCQGFTTPAVYEFREMIEQEDYDEIESELISGNPAHKFLAIVVLELLDEQGIHTLSSTRREYISQEKISYQKLFVCNADQVSTYRFIEIFQDEDIILREAREALTFPAASASPLEGG